MWRPPLPSGQGSQPSPTVASADGRYPSPRRCFYFPGRGAGHLWLRGPVNNGRPARVGGQNLLSVERSLGALLAALPS